MQVLLVLMPVVEDLLVRVVVLVVRVVVLLVLQEPQLSQALAAWVQP